MVEPASYYRWKDVHNLGYTSESLTFTMSNVHIVFRKSSKEWVLTG